MVTEEKLLYYADEIFDMCLRKNMKIFDGFVPIVEEIYDDDGYVFFSDVKPTDLTQPVNICSFRLGRPDGRHAEKDWQFYRLRSISRKELRKRTGCFAVNPYCLEVAFQSTQKIADAFFTFENGKFKLIKIPNYETPEYLENETIRVCQMSLGIQFGLENTCHVYLKPENSEIGFNYLITSMEQLKHLFALRDIPDGNKRRAALRHWVAKHMRHKPSKPDEMVEVRKHLRGKEDFKWFGIEGTIYVNA